ncbi:hypothetical protein, partial [Roseateles koreensis]
LHAEYTPLRIKTMPMATTKKVLLLCLSTWLTIGVSAAWAFYPEDDEPAGVAKELSTDQLSTIAAAFNCNHKGRAEITESRCAQGAREIVSRFNFTRSD